MMKRTREALHQQLRQSERLRVVVRGTRSLLRSRTLLWRFPTRYEPNKDNRYATYYEELELQDKVILYESMSGDKMADNPLALFEAILKDKRFKDYLHVWSMGSPENIPEEYKNKDNIIFVKRSSDTYLRHLASAKYLICNAKLPGYFIRKPGQRYLNTWHGTAYKKLGADTRKSLVGEDNTTRNFLQASHILTPNDHMSQVQQDAYNLRGLYSGQIAETGYPRIDMTINATEEQKQQLRKELGLVKSKKTILYAPTWRPGKKFDTARLQVDLKRLGALDANVIFMGHHIMQREMQTAEGLDTIISTGPLMNSNRLLTVVDVLITDYSSIFYDFLVTGKPVVHYLYDLEKYTRKRGLYFGVDELPGEVVYDLDELIKVTMKCTRSGYRLPKRYAAVKEKFCTHEDGHVSQRVIDWFFFDKKDGVLQVPKENPKKRLFVIGDVANLSGIQPKYRRLLAIRSSYKNYILAPPSSSDIDRTELMEKLAKSAILLGYIGNNGMTKTEWSGHDLVRPVKRNYRRIFGDASFDTAINLDENNPVWDAFVAYAVADDIEIV